MEKKLTRGRFHVAHTGAEAGVGAAGESKREAGGSVVPEQEGKVCRIVD